ncbi:minor tail protein [Arthrobacter phage Atuin]|nr:minor tail protein [Arthrobacter phage Atuin]
MILKQDTLSITLEGTVFRAKPYMNPQFVLDEEALKGFYDGVNVKRTEAVRPNKWGDFAEPGLLGPRNITISGAAVASTPSQLHSLRDELMSILHDGSYREMEVRNSDGPRYITVALAGSPSWVQKIDTAAVWKLELYAPDPRMYGEEKTTQITDGTLKGGINFPISYPLNFGGAIVNPATSIYNDGNTKSWPVFKVTGDYPSGFKIWDGLNNFITYDGIVSTQSPVTIDTFRGAAFQNGIDQSVALSRRDWFSIPPKSSIAPRFLPIQDSFGWCDIMYRDTWI